jgi:hypothetical protein
MPIDFNLVNNPLCQTRSKDDTSLYIIVDDPVDAAETLNTDFAKIHDWSMKWLVNFNPDNVLIMLTVVKAFLVIRSTCLSQFPSSDIVRPKCLCSDTMLIILLSITMVDEWPSGVNYGASVLYYLY